MPSQGEETGARASTLHRPSRSRSSASIQGTRARIVTDELGISYRIQVRADAPQSTIR